MKTYILLIGLLSSTFSFSQTNISGIVNDYREVTAISTTGPCGSGSSFITISGTTTPFNAGDRVMMIQMKGADLNHTSTDPVVFGTVSALNNAGNYEFNTVISKTATTIEVNPLKENYTVSGKVQIIRVPVYANANVSGTLTGQAWNGTTGGVLSIEVTGTLTVLANITMDGLGFLGGVHRQDGPKNCSQNLMYYSITNGTFPLHDQSKKAGLKGESISAVVTGKELGVGRWATAGGGGGAHNGGGGGGGYRGAGGRGGRQYEGCAAADATHGLGGTTVAATASRLYMGGGGGSGDDDENWGTGGGPGGGIIIITANTIINNSFPISASGSNGPTSPAGGSSGQDGMGGGGAGGTIALQSAIFNFTNVPVYANGGIGGSSHPAAGTFTFHGPGGGGGGGLIWFSSGVTPAGAITNVTGGTPGFTRNHDATRSHWEATDGMPGQVAFNFIRNQSPCSLPVTLLLFDAIVLGEKVKLIWSTSSEINNAYFIIERSVNGNDFSEVGYVKGNGNSNVVINYEAWDENPLSGISYYRLKQVDVDGTVSYSHWVYVHFKYEEYIGKIYPNPVKAGEPVYLHYFLNDPGIIKITLYNAEGKEVYFDGSLYKRGMNEIKMNTFHLASGIYYLHIFSQDKVTTQKIVVI